MVVFIEGPMHFNTAFSSQEVLEAGAIATYPGNMGKRSSRNFGHA